MKKLLLVVVALLALSASLVNAQAAVESVCLITDVGRVNDKTFNQFAYEGMVRAAEDFSLESTFIETTSQTDYRANMDTCISEGYDVIVSVGFLMADATVQAANENPDVYFIGVDQFIMDNPDTADVNEAPANMVGVQFREDQAGFLAGAMAALMTESGIVGGVYGVDIPPVKKFRNGFEQGARYINPDISLLGVYIDSFAAPDRGAAAAEQFLGEGADVIFGAGGPTGSGAITFAAGEGAYVIGVDQDEYLTTFGEGETPGAENIITSAVKRVDQAVYLSIEALVNGDMEAFNGGGVRVLSADNDGVAFAVSHEADVPEEVIDQVSEIFTGMQNRSVVTGVDPVSGDLLLSIAEIAAASPQFSTLLAAVEAAGLTETLAGPGPFTVFAPTDEAFAAALEALGLTAEELLADTETLTAILTYHVVAGGAADSSFIVANGNVSVPTVQGEEIMVEITESGVVLNGGISVTAYDIYAANGVVHVIDLVLLPPSMMNQ
jgi:basic membrane protein A and related proteins